MTGYVGPIEKITEKNKCFRQVLFTGKHLGDSREIIIPTCSHRIAKSGGYGLDLAIQAEQVGTI